jgi:uncharacterized membrane protein
MLASIGIVVFALLVMIIEIRPLQKKRYKKEQWAFLILLFLATGFSIMHVLKINLPSPHDLISFVYKPLSDAIYNFLE